MVQLKQTKLALLQLGGRFELFEAKLLLGVKVAVD